MKFISKLFSIFCPYNDSIVSLYKLINFLELFSNEFFDKDVDGVSFKFLLFFLVLLLFELKLFFILLLFLNLLFSLLKLFVNIKLKLLELIPSFPISKVLFILFSFLLSFSSSIFIKYFSLFCIIDLQSISISKRFPPKSDI